MNSNDSNFVMNMNPVPPSQTPTYNAPSGANYSNQGNPNTFFEDFGQTVGIPANITDSAITQFGFNYGKQVFGKSSQKYAQSFSMLKYYFNVNNSYVVNKLKLLLFPLRHKYWQRRMHRTDEGEVFLPPRDDINAPDLYIPTMAFITYVLIIGYIMGSTYRFTPEILGVTATKGLVVLLLEVMIVKFGLYLLNSLTLPMLDVIAYCGYKYVGIVLTAVGGFVFGPYVFYGLMLTTSIFMAIFMVKTLKLSFPDSMDAPAKTQHRNYFLISVAALQLVLGYYLAYDTTIAKSSTA